MISVTSPSPVCASWRANTLGQVGRMAIHAPRGVESRSSDWAARIRVLRAVSGLVPRFRRSAACRACARVADSATGMLDSARQWLAIRANWAMDDQKPASVRLAGSSRVRGCGSAKATCPGCSRPPPLGLHRGLSARHGQALVARPTAPAQRSAERWLREPEAASTPRHGDLVPARTREKRHPAGAFEPWSRRSIGTAHENSSAAPGSET